MESSYVKHLNNNINRYTNNSDLIAGIAMLILNIGTRYIHLDLSKNQDEFIKTTAFRRVAIFTIFWIGTKDMFLILLISFCSLFLFLNIFICSMQ